MPNHTIGERLTFDRLLGAISRVRRRGQHVPAGAIDRESLSRMSWAQVRQMLQQAYSRRGYAVEQAGRDSPVDMVLRRGDETTFIACRHWSVWEVGDGAVREMWGYSRGAGAQRAKILTTGMFSPAARAFARSHDLELVDGSAVLALVA